MVGIPIKNFDCLKLVFFTILESLLCKNTVFVGKLAIHAVLLLVADYQLLKFLNFFFGKFEFFYKVEQEAGTHLMVVAS